MGSVQTAPQTLIVFPCVMCATVNRLVGDQSTALGRFVMGPVSNEDPRGPSFFASWSRHKKVITKAKKAFGPWLDSEEGGEEACIHTINIAIAQLRELMLVEVAGVLQIKLPSLY